MDGGRKGAWHGKASGREATATVEEVAFVPVPKLRLFYHNDAEIRHAHQVEERRHMPNKFHQILPPTRALPTHAHTSQHGICTHAGYCKGARKREVGHG